MGLYVELKDVFHRDISPFCIDAQLKSTYTSHYIKEKTDMGQVTIYLDNELEEKMHKITKDLHISKSKWVADLIKEKISDEWPESVRSLAGAWRDLPSAEEIREAIGNDIDREVL